MIERFDLALIEGLIRCQGVRLLAGMVRRAWCPGKVVVPPEVWRLKIVIVILPKAICHLSEGKINRIKEHQG